MGATPVFKFQTVETSTNYEFDTIVNSVVTSIENNLPHRFVNSLSQLNALSGSLYPSGQIAILTQSTSGLWSGAMFVRAGNVWRFTSGTVSNLSTFLSNLSANIGTIAGATFYDVGAGVTKVFTNTTGNAETLIGGSTWTNISYPSGLSKPSFGYTIGYRLVPGGAMLRGVVQRTNGKAFANGTTLCTVPAVARPSQTVFLTAVGAGNGIATLQCNSSGALTVKASGIRTSSWYSLDGFFLAQS